jgi:RNA recognition motif-containing protein
LDHSSLDRDESHNRRIFTVTNIFVGNLSYSTTQDDLHAAFSNYGGVERVNIVTDRETGQPRGFAFVEMSEPEAARNAIAQLNGTDLNGRTMNVSEARPKPSGGGGYRAGGRPERSGGGRGRGSRW